MRTMFVVLLVMGALDAGIQKTNHGLSIVAGFRLVLLLELRKEMISLH
jgi:hypothetical protein